jgi:uncharacterized phage protein (TIGR02218 family)
MAAHVAGNAHYRVWMQRLDLHDGTVIGLTSNNKNVVFDLGDGNGPITYLAGTGCNISDVETVLGLAPSNYEVLGPIADVVTLDALVGGRFNDAEARLFQVNPEHSGYGAIKVLLGIVTDVRIDGGEFTLEVSSEAAKLNQAIGRIVSPQCSADFADAQCGVVAEEIAVTVVAVTDDLEFVVSYPSGSYADNYFNYGKMEFATGALAGIRPIQIFQWEDTGGLTGGVTLLVPAAEAPSVGDTGTVKRGCSKIRKSDDPAIPTCKTYNNVARMRAFPDCIGSDQALRAAVPGEA